MLIVGIAAGVLVGGIAVALGFMAYIAKGLRDPE